MLDVPATIKKIKEVSGSKKVAYMGYSQGSTMLFYALTKDTEENYLAENRSCFIALAPCMVPPQLPVPYESWIKDEWQALELNLYPNVFGEGWDT